MKSARFVLVVLFAAATFASAAQPTIFTTSSFIQSPDGFTRPLMVLGDVNGDGKLDMIVAQTCSGLIGCVGILLGNGDGTFQTGPTYGSGGTNLESVRVEDVNGDGKLDLIVTNECVSDTDCTNGSVGVLLGNGDGTFQASLTYGAGGPDALNLAVGDVNGDGKLDLVVSLGCHVSPCPSQTISVLLGNGDGSFQTAVLYNAGGVSGGFPSVAIADVNGDGKRDVVVTPRSANNIVGGAVSVLLGNGDGTFKPPVVYDVGPDVTVSVVVADVNRDGKPDLLVSDLCFDSNCVTGAVNVLLGNGDGTFKPAVAYSSGGYLAQNVAVGDVNGDGIPDLLVDNICAVVMPCNPNKPSGHSTVGVLLGSGDGTFQTARAYMTGGVSASSLVLGDVNGDGKLDALVVAFNNTACCDLGGVGVLINTLPALITKTTLTSSANPSHVNQSVTFTATVAGLYGGTTTGSVKFKQGSIVLGTAAVVGGKAKLTHAFAKTGTFSIYAVFSGDHNSRPSTSAIVSQVVTP